MNEKWLQTKIIKRYKQNHYLSKIHYKYRIVNYDICFQAGSLCFHQRELKTEPNKIIIYDLQIPKVAQNCLLACGHLLFAISKFLI